MKYRFIFNPRSGRNLGRLALATGIREFIRSRALDADFTVTEGPRHATELARAAVLAGCERIVAVGGDGTMNEVAQGLLEGPAALALVPCGSGNGLARHLGLPRSPLAALQLATGPGARVARVDSGCVNGRPFFNAMGLGLDAEVSRRFNHLTRRGLAAYARVAWQALREHRSEECTIECHGRTESLAVLLVAVANSDQYGNNARIAPGARVDDGRLDLVAIKAIGWGAAAALVPRLFLGTIDQSPQVLPIRAPRFVIRRTKPGYIHTDGETHAEGAVLDVTVRPGSLPMLIPAVSRAVAEPAATARFALRFP